MKTSSRLKILAPATFAWGLFLAPAQAVTLDFNDINNLGVTLGGGMTWSSRGGGHLYNEYYHNDDQIFLPEPSTYVNSFQMNASPWKGYRGGQIGLIDVDARDANGVILWSQTLDLRPYTNWSNWLTVEVNVPNVAQLYFHAPGTDPHFHGFWPSIDNLVINQPVAAAATPEAVPEGGMTLGMFGMGLAGLVWLRRHK